MKKETIYIINGANLNLLGDRETDIYGSISMKDFIKNTKAKFHNFNIHFFQSNIEGEIINFIHEAAQKNAKGIVINPGGYSHSSVAIADAIRAVKTPCIEVHISNIYARESYRQEMITASACQGLISGLGLSSYTLAIQALLNI